MTTYYKDKGASLYNALLDMYVEYGLYKEDLVSLYMNTRQFEKAMPLIHELDDKIGKTEQRDVYKATILNQGTFL